MNNKHILDLTLRLSQSLDQNYDVVSMDTVLSVISALEGSTITKEQLEATRLAKYINQLRRRTKCENLARRAKSLLKKWREMVGIQQSNESLAGATSNVATAPAASSVKSISVTTPNMPMTDNAVSTSYLPNQIGHQQYQRQTQHQTNVKQQQPYNSQPSSPVNLPEKSNPNEYLISISNPATGSQKPKSSTSNVRKKKRLEKDLNVEPVSEQPTSFANLLTGLGNTFTSTRKTCREKPEAVQSSLKPVETFVIEHSSNSNSDLICLPSNNTASSNFTSVTDVPPVVIDLQDTNSSMNSLVSKDVTNASSTFYRTKSSAKKIKKEKKRKERNVMTLQTQPLQDGDDQNTTTASCHQKRLSNLLLDEKSHSACPTISNISEILSLSNSSMSSVFPSADAMSKNIFQSGHNEFVSLKMSKSDLTFAGKFKQNTSSTLGGCNDLNYSTDNTNLNVVCSDFPNQKKFSLFGGVDIGTNSNDSTSNSRTQFNVVIDGMKTDASNSKHYMEDVLLKDNINEKSMSNMSSTDNTFPVSTLNVSATHQQSIAMDSSSEKNVKQPKKRGRKKGSKGVDSVIAKENSLSSQMLISPLSLAGKKVKTTKELYAEMENRKLRNVKTASLGDTTSNWNAQQQQKKPVTSRRASYFSDIAESDSGTMTSEPSRDSVNVFSKTLGKPETKLDNNSNYSKKDSELKIMCGEACNSAVVDSNSSFAITSKIKNEMQEILKLLTPPASVKEIEVACFNNMTPCSCTVEEVISRAENFTAKINVETNSTDPNFSTKNSTNVKERIALVTNVTDNVKISYKNQKDILPQRTFPLKVKKSIFDLDFDDDEDPLNSIIADIAGKNLKTETKTETTLPVVDKKSETMLNAEDNLVKADVQNTPYALNVPTNIADNIIFPSYEVKYDTHCKAKNRFEIQTQKITKFHIDTLHNWFIPNVNGNWNHANVVSSTTTVCKNITTENGKSDTNSRENYLITDGYDVVPLFGSDMNVQIVKDLSHIQFTKKLKVKHFNYRNEILFQIPFLGVSRMSDIGDAKFQIKDVKNLNLDEEKENVDDKFNLLITSALDTRLTNVNNGCEAKEIGRVQNDNDPLLNLKRTKKYTNVKSFTVKRLKLAAYRSKKNSSDYNSDCGDDRNYMSDVDKLEDNNFDSANEFHHEVVNYDIMTSKNVDNKNHRQKCLRKRIHRKNLIPLKKKIHNTLFYHDEICPMIRSGSKKHIFQISSCTSSCSADEEVTSENLRRVRTISSSSSVSSYSSECSDNKYDSHMFNMQQYITKSEFEKQAINTSECEHIKIDEAHISCIIESEDDLPKENNRMLLSFNNIFKKSTRDENKDHENNVLKQQLHNCDDYNNLKNNFNLIKYIDNKTSSDNIINNSCSNNYSDTNIIVSSSSCNNENPTNSSAPITYNNNNGNNGNDNVQTKPFKEYQTGLRAVDEDVNDEDGNSYGRLQQFKEWHEVLQLRSYNDELLTVLPYVVLE